MNCDICKTKYYTIIDKPGQCVTKEDAPKNVYFDESKQVFINCYETCGTCSSNGNSSQNNCNSCLQDETFKYYFLDGKIGQCVNLTIIGDNYYLKKGVYYKCYETCGICSKGGNSINNNCDECLKDNNGNYLYHFIYNHTGQCISEKEKPNNLFLNDTSNTYILCPNGSIISDGACIQLLSLNELIYELGNNEFVLTLLNQTYENPNENYTFQVTTNTSDIDIYVNKIKEVFNIPKNSNLLVGILTIINIDETSSRFISRVFADDGTELDILEFNEDFLTINLDFNGTQTLTPKLAKYIHDYNIEYDVFEPKNKFYNDYCASFQDPNGHDVTLEERQKYYYYNYCGNCKYISINYLTKKITCKCSIKENNLNEKIIFSSSPSINFIILKCIKEAFNSKFLKKNVCFYLLFIYIIALPYLFISFIINEYPQLIIRVKNAIYSIKNTNDYKNKRKNILNKNNYNKDISDEDKYSNNHNEKSYFNIFWEIFKKENSLCRCIFRESIFETYCFNFSFFIMYLTFILLFNSLFLNNNILILIFYDKFKIFQYFLSPLLSCIATQIILFFPKIIFFNYPIIQSILTQKNIRNLVQKVKNQFIKYFIILYIITILNLLYLTCFCSIFNGSQKILFKGLLLSLFYFFLINLIITAIVIQLKLYGIKYENEKILTIQNFIENFNKFF